MTIDASLEIRKLPPSHISQLSSILESAAQWKKLMAIVPSILLKDNFECTISCENIAKYNSDHIRLIEIASQKFNRASTEILFEEWGCSGRIRPAVGHLFNLLVKAELFRAADYVAEKILYWQKPKRPSQGPAAPISTNINGQIIKELLDNIDYSSSLLENVNPYSFNNNLDHGRKTSIVPQIVVTPEPDELGEPNTTEGVLSMIKFSTSCSPSGSTTSSLPDLVAPSVSDKSEISSGPNVPVISELKCNTDNYIPYVSSLDQQAGENIRETVSSMIKFSASCLQSESTTSSLPVLFAPSISDKSEISSGPNVPVISELNTNTDSYIPNLSSLNQQSGGNIPNISSLDQQSGGNIPITTSSYDRSGGNIPNISSLDQQSVDIIPDISSLDQQSGGNIPNITSSEHQSGETLPNISSLDQDSVGVIPSISSLDQESVDNIPNISSLDQQSERNISSVSNSDHDSKENILPNLSGLFQNSDNVERNSDDYMPNLSILNQESKHIPKIGHFINENVGTHSNLSSDLSDYSLPNIITLNSTPKMDDSGMKMGKTEVPPYIPNLSVLIAERRRSSLNISNTFESSKIRQCSSPLPNLTLNTCLPHFAYHELEVATQNFNDEPFKNLNESGRFLGSGAFGKVFLASGLLNKLVAVKRISLDNVEVVNVNDAVTKQFKNEVEILSRLKHENLLAIVGYSCDGCTYCLLYDYISGGTLKDRLQNVEKKLMWKERLSIALGTSKAVSYLHTASSLPLIHRDIKTANILLDCSNQPKLGDFGITKLLNNQNTNTCTVIGTSAYMAPEALRGDISVKCDTYSFGVVLLELLTSLPVFDENREGNDLVSHVEEECEDSIQILLDTSVGTWTRNDNDFAEEVFAIAKKCLEEKKKRPIMVDVTKFLVEIVTKLQL